MRTKIMAKKCARKKKSGIDSEKEGNAALRRQLEEETK
jgi:hypothetical protein